MSKNKISKNPLDLETSKFKPLEILHNYGGLVIAQGIWEKRHMAVAARWHSEDDIGYPNGFGHPQWFLLQGTVKSLGKDTTKIIAGQYKKLLTLEFESLVPSPYIIEHDDALNAIIKYGIANNIIKFEKAPETPDVDPSLPHAKFIYKPEDMIVITPMNLAKIPFFRPYTLDMDDDEVFTAGLNGAERVYQQVIVKSKEDDGSLFWIYYGIDLEQRVKYSDFLRLGYSLTKDNQVGE